MIKSFFQSDTIFVRFVFILLILIITLFLISMGSKLITYSVSPSADPYLIKGMINAENQLVITQDPAVNGTIPIIRSQDEKGGITFSWSVWLFISDLQYGSGKYKHIFHKGNDGIQFDSDQAGLNFPNNGPGMYIAPNSNDLVVIMNTYTSINEEIIVPNLPMKKWFHVLLRVEGENLDIYMNGSIAKRHVLADVPKQNYGDVFIAMNGGFNGYISCLRYYSRSVQPGELQNIVDSGPCMKMLGGDLTNNIPPYLSLRWYFQGMDNEPQMANPPQYMP